MEIEIRNLNKYRFSKISHYDFDIVGIGSEGCPHKLPEVKDILEMYSIVSGQGRKFRLITPITPQSDLNYVLGVIKDTVEQIPNIDITINDLGVLYACQDIRNNQNCNFNIGPGLVVSMMQCSWFEYILRDETDFVKKAYLQTNMNHDKKIDFLKNYGVQGVEVPCVSSIMDSFTYLDKKGLEVIAHMNYVPIAYARACHTARFYKINPPNCVDKCETVIKTRLKEMFDLSQIIPRYIEADTNVKTMLSDFWLLGNVTYTKESLPKFISNSVKFAVLESRFYSDSELKTNIDLLKLID